MARLTIADIPKSAAEIIQAHQKEAPVKVGAIAQDLSVDVFISDLPINISGMLIRASGQKNKWIIRVNRHEHKNRQRFTIAHEIAHFILHKDAITDRVVDDKFYRSGLSEKREWEANALAADILMPWSLIRKLTKENGKDVAAVAKALAVSEAAIHIRLGLPT